MKWHSQAEDFFFFSHALDIFPFSQLDVEHSYLNSVQGCESRVPERSCAVVRICGRTQWQDMEYRRSLF